MDINRMISEAKDEVVALRRDFHQHPELGLEEWRTSEKVVDYLAGRGFAISRANVTGVVGLLRGDRPGPTLMLRADMDALPIQEETDLPFKSVHKGLMHACGHDAHTAMLLSAAGVLSKLRERIAGNIKFLFEPNEENVGALAMIQEGVLDNPRVDACMGLHVWTPLRTGRIGLCAGPVMAGMEHFELVISGRGGHTAAPHSAIDPVLAAAAVIQGVQLIQTREVDALKGPAVIMFGKIQGGTASNVIPDSVSLSGTLRYLFEGSQDNPQNPRKRFIEVVDHICAAHRVSHELNFVYGHPSLVNDADMTELVRAVAAGGLSSQPHIEPLVTLAGEDFSEFAARVPSVFYFLGAGPETVENPFPHHHPRFEIDERVLPLGVEMHVKTALKFFEQEEQTSGARNA